MVYLMNTLTGQQENAANYTYVLILILIWNSKATQFKSIKEKHWASMAGQGQMGLD